MRIVRKLAKAAAALSAIIGLVAIVTLAASCAAFGAAAQGDRQARMRASPQWDDGHFENPQPLWNDMSIRGLMQATLGGSDFASPEDPAHDIPVIRGDGARFATPPPSGLRVTWLGHSTTLIELDGVTLLTDPVWGERTSPISWLGPKRWYEAPIPLDALPPVDAVVISHDHYDHLDYPTFEIIKDWDTTFLVPLGVGAHLELWGVPAERIVELDWGDEHRLGGVTLACTPARHASGRGLLDQNATLWAGWALVGPEHRVFFSGDTGLFDGLKDIGEAYGPFDVTMVEVGAYHMAWPDWHMGPEQAILAHQWLKGKAFIPIHWGLFNLALHGWTEPIERVRVAAEEAGVAYTTLRPGESVDPLNLPTPKQWWPDVPWETAAEHPIVATGANGRPAR